MDATPIAASRWNGVARPITALLATTIALTALCPPSSAEVIASEQAASGISSARGMAIWSSWNARTKNYRLRLYANGVVRTLSVPPRPVVFDVDLGIDHAGRTVAVYSRCRKERSTWLQAEGCDLYRLRLATGKEQRLRGRPNTRTASEFMPSLDDHQLAFARRYEQRGGAAAIAPSLLLYDFRTARTSSLPSGTRGDYISIEDEPTYGGPHSLRLDLKGTRLAVAWSYVDERCGELSKSGGFTSLDEIWVMTTKGNRTLVARDTCDDYWDIKDNPTLSADSVIYMTGHREGERVVRRFDIRTRKQTVSNSYENAFSLAGGDGALFTIEYASRAGAKQQVLRTTPQFGAP